MLSSLFGRRADRPLPSSWAIRRLARSIYVGSDIALCRVLGRYKMYVDARDMSVSAHLMLDGQWELWVTRAMRDLLRPGAVAVDVGANLGYFSVVMADRVGPAGHVHAFEPNPRLTGLIRRNAIVNGYHDRLTVHETPLGREDGREVRFAVPEDQLGGAATWEMPAPDYPGSRVLTTLRLDGIAGMDAVEFIKIDAEGAEEAIWQGMSGLLAGDRLRTVFIEFTPGRYADPAAFLASLRAPGFTLARVDPKRGVVPAVEAEILSGPPAKDVMLVLTR